MIAGAVSIDIFIRHFPAGNFGNEIKRLQNRYRVFPATSKIVNLSNPRLANEFIDKPGNIERMNIISNLFSFITKDLVGFFLEIALDEITEKSVQFDTGMVRSG